MGYATSDGLVRCSIFKPSGKWDRDVAIDMGPHYHHSFVCDAIRSAIEMAGITIHRDWMYVVLEPFHQYAHPVMFKRII